MMSPDAFRALMLYRHGVPHAQSDWELGVRDAIMDRMNWDLMPRNHFVHIDAYARGYLHEAYGHLEGEQ